MTTEYLHGFSRAEQDRLVAQARFLEKTVFAKVDFSQSKEVLEIGCGVGAQTEILLKRFPEIKLTSVDASEAQLARARERVKDKRVQFHKEDAKNLSFLNEKFDAIFICWLLEHVDNPQRVCEEAFRVLKPGGTIYCTEVMNASLFLHPYSPATLNYWFKFNDHQWTIHGDPFVGAKLGNLLLNVGFKEVKTTPLIFHYDNRTPRERKDMMQYWTELLLSGTDSLLQAGHVQKDDIQAMKSELETLKTAQDSVFFYSAIQASSSKN